ncbi:MULTISPECIES: TetR/AcrR family transcriptional regulator [Streptomyces]|uniref:TetR family transcriptional regulator n=1 Tax=Streptomyces canarius TaxID=285453 RepID=A0ABQ3CGX6_9ACTN|nr:TetR/AcrR family transcriptional regulator [Streptomyces canarius]GHA14296.1 TetR family transcriptional regulator [Streptomyces canarius]
MKNRERAACTRANLVLAAARHFDRHGYDGTTLNSVCVEANVTLGALTFHFRSKAALASAVVEEGIVELERLSTANSATGRPLDGLSSLTLGVATALQTAVVTRAAVRLVEEGHVRSDWPGAFRAEVLRLLEEAALAGELAADVRPATAAHLIMYVMEGVAAQSRRAAAEGGPAVADIAEVWRAVLGGLAPHMS